jgi:hypothetical protein
MAKVQEKKFISKLLPTDVGGQPRSVRVVLGNGVEVVGCLDNYTPEMVERLALHGLSQKLGDGGASFSKTNDYHGAFGAIQGIEDNLRNNAWSVRTGGGTADLTTAIAELQGLELSDADELVKRMTEEQLAEVKKHPKVKAKIAELVSARAAEAAKASPDEDGLKSLLAGIGLGA